VTLALSDLPPDQRGDAADVVDNEQCVAVQHVHPSRVAARRYILRTRRLPCLRR
jgi:hypothetical protein